MSTDDPREVDWAERHIRELERQLSVLTDRVKRLESQTEFETSEDDANISELSDRVDGLRDAVIRRDERINSMDAVISSQGRAIGDLERRWVRVWEFMKQSDEGQVEAQDVSPHVHWNITPGREIHIIPPTGSGPLRKGYDAGYEMGVNDAVNRLMGFFNKRPGQFPKAFLEDIINAVHGS